MINLEDVKEKLQEVYDPEIGINVLDLGLIYKIEEVEAGILHIQMTMTTPGCPAHESMSENVEWAASQAFGVTNTVVDVVWNPPWTPDLMTPTAKMLLGFR